MDTDIVKACIFGHAVGDALGVPVEFSSREELDEEPVMSMEGFGTFPVPAGSWSDDTSMTLCALDSLAKGTLDFSDVMENFGRWYYHGAYTPTGETYDVGNACSIAIENYFERNHDVAHCGLTEETDNGNGSLMRILPFALYLHERDLPVEQKIELIHRASALTHAHERAKVACGIYSFVLWTVLEEKKGKESVARGLQRAYRFYLLRSTESQIRYNRLFRKIGTVPPEATREEIGSSGYVVDTLEAAIWCLLRTDSYAECVLTAVNLGDDTDTTAAVAGGLAGALYGLSAIPREWLATLQKREYIEQLCEQANRAF